MTRTRRSFTDEFKCEAVKQCKQPGATVTHIARDLGIDAGVLRRWVTQERGGVLDLRANRPLRSEAATEVERLQRELRRVTIEVVSTQIREIKLPMQLTQLWQPRQWALRILAPRCPRRATPPL
jgi:transposase